MQGKRKRICFATWELKGFSVGGIGVLIYNLIKNYSVSPDCEISILWYGKSSVSAKMFNDVFVKCKFYQASFWAAKDTAGEFLPDATSYISFQQLQSLELMRALRALEAACGAFDVIEFPDFDGAALATIEEKKLGKCFRDTKIAIRIHSTEAALRPYDHRPITPANSVRADMERKALRDADLIVAHLKPVLYSVANLFNFDEDWISRAVIEHPPVFTEIDTATVPFSWTEDTSIVLPSKVQWFKRPSVFIDGVITFMLTNTSFRGSAFLLTLVIDDELRRHCDDLIPVNLKERIVLMSGLADDVRAKLISRSVVVVPSAYESFCLAAYEASQMGGLMVLNGQNPAFGAGTPWVDGENCRKFDGTGLGLASALNELWVNRGEIVFSRVALNVPVIPYWLRALPHPPAQIVKEREGGISVIVLWTDALGDPLETISSALQETTVAIEVVLVSRLGVLAPEHLLAVSRLNESALGASGTLKIADMRFNGSDGELLNLGVEISTFETLAVVRAGAVFRVGFLSRAAHVLSRNSNYSVLLPQIAYRRQTQLVFPAPVLGEALRSASWRNLFGNLEMVISKDCAKAVRFDSILDRYIDWDFHFRAVARGFRYVVCNEVSVLVELPGSKKPQNFRSHFDAVLAGHAAVFQGGRVPLLSVYEGNEAAARNMSNEPGVTVLGGDQLIFGRPVSYYLTETRPWWVVAYKSPLRIFRWLLVRNIQRSRARYANGRRGFRKR